VDESAPLALAPARGFTKAHRASGHLVLNHLLLLALALAVALFLNAGDRIAKYTVRAADPSAGRFGTEMTLGAIPDAPVAVASGSFPGTLLVTRQVVDVVFEIIPVMPVPPPVVERSGCGVKALAILLTRLDGASVRIITPVLVAIPLVTIHQMELSFVVLPPRGIQALIPAVGSLNNTSISHRAELSPEAIPVELPLRSILLPR